MKKIVTIQKTMGWCLAIAFCFLLAGCGSEKGKGEEHNTPTPTTPVEDVTSSPETEVEGNKEEFITLEKAKEIALSHAELSASDVTFTKEKFEQKPYKAEFDIEFLHNGMEYEYEIDAKTGEILEFSVEGDKNSAQKNSSNFIGIDAAKDIALASAGVKRADVHFTKAKLDKEDNVFVYEIEFYIGNTEYEYELNASTGHVRSYSKEVKNR